MQFSERADPSVHSSCHSQPVGTPETCKSAHACCTCCMVYPHACCTCHMICQQAVSNVVKACLRQQADNRSKVHNAVTTSGAEPDAYRAKGSFRHACPISLIACGHSLGTCSPAHACCTCLDQGQGLMHIEPRAYSSMHAPYHSQPVDTVWEPATITCMLHMFGSDAGHVAY